MRWKKPKWVQNIQKKADDIVKPITTSTPVKAVQRAATNTFVKPIQQIAKKLPPPPPKPKVVQQVQKAAQKTADKVGQGAKDVAKQTGQAINKAADKVGDVVRPAAQSVAKEVGHMVNPAIGEVALRGKQLAQSSAPVLKRIGDKLGDAGREASEGLKRAGQQAADGGGQLLPYFTKLLPDTLSDTAKGLYRTGKGLVTLDGDEIVSGIKRTGRGIGDTLYHTAVGGVVEPVVRMFGRGPSNRTNSVQEYEDDTTVQEVDKNGKVVASGGAGVTPLPPYPEDEEPTNSSNGRTVASGGAQMSGPSWQSPDTDDQIPGGGLDPNGINTIGTPVPVTPSKSQGPTDASSGGPIATALTSASPEQLYSDFYTQYRDIASPLQLITYQKAAESGDFKKMREIEAKLRGTA